MKSYSICQANKLHGSDYWYGRINDDGEVKYISLKTKRKSEAQEWLSMMNARRFLPEERDGWKKRDKFLKAPGIPFFLGNSLHRSGIHR